jgi:hypothetical protein
VLAGASEYFRKRLEWDNDFWTMTGDVGKPLLVVGVEEGLHQAAAAVVRVMYEEVVPDGTPALQLAKVCTGAGGSISAGWTGQHLLPQALLGFRIFLLWVAVQICGAANSTLPELNIQPRLIGPRVVLDVGCADVHNSRHVGCARMHGMLFDSSCTPQGITTGPAGKDGHLAAPSRCSSAAGTAWHLGTPMCGTGV